MNLEVRAGFAHWWRTIRGGARPRGARLTQDRIRELSHQLEEEKKALEQFTASMEDEFLVVGNLLRKTASIAREVKDRSGEIVNAAAGHSEDAAMQFAFQLLKKAEDVVRASREQYTCVFQVFEQLHADLTRVARERARLLKTLLPLESTNTQFRVQACAFDEITRTQFFALSETITGIVREVQSAVGQRFEELDRTGLATREAVKNLSALAVEQNAKTDRMLAETRAHLSTLSAALSSSERTAEAISEAGANIVAGVAKAVVALQCQDMAHQKFEHIGSAIDEMIAHLSSGAAGAFRAEQEADCLHFLGDASRVQLGQLRGVFGQLDEAGRQVGAGLKEVEAAAKSLADQAARSGAAALDGHIIEQAIESIHAVLGVIENAVTGIRSVVELVVRLKSTFRDCTSQIVGPALGLRMVALNAQIFAAHVDAGMALEVVARNTRVIAEESMQQLDGISRRVGELVESVVNLEQRLGDYSELARIEQKLLAEEAAQSEKKLRTLEKDLRAALAAIGPLEGELAHTIQQAIQSIRFPEAVAEAGARSTALFEWIAGNYSDSGSVSHHKVAKLTHNYTMEHEREVHESVLNAAPQMVAEPAPAPAETIPENLPGNVELF